MASPLKGIAKVCTRSETMRMHYRHRHGNHLQCVSQARDPFMVSESMLKNCFRFGRSDYSTIVHVVLRTVTATSNQMHDTAPWRRLAPQSKQWQSSVELYHFDALQPIACANTVAHTSQHLKKHPMGTWRDIFTTTGTHHT